MPNFVLQKSLNEVYVFDIKIRPGQYKEDKIIKQSPVNSGVKSCD